MKKYKVRTLTGQWLTIEADQVEFGPGHVVFSNGAYNDVLVRALRTPQVAEVTEEMDE